MTEKGVRTLWSPWSFFLSGCFALESFICFSIVFADPSDDIGTGWQVFFCSAGVVGLAAGIRNPFRRVIIEGGHVLRVGWFTRKELFICSATIEDAGSGPLADFLRASQPVVTTVAGKRVKLDELVGFGGSNSRVTRSVELLQELAQSQIQNHVATVQHPSEDQQRTGRHRKRTTS